MRTLDEEILYLKEVADRNKEQWKNCPADRRDIKHQTCEECAEEFEQLVKWLEQLKEYMINEFQCHLAQQEGITIGYEKAINDFSEWCNKNHIDFHKDSVENIKSKFITEKENMSDKTLFPRYIEN